MRFEVTLEEKNGVTKLTSYEIASGPMTRMTTQEKMYAEHLEWAKAIKKRIESFIPPEIVDKIPTEEDAPDLEALRAFLQERDHPIVSRWKAVPTEEPGEISVPTLELPVGAVPIQGVPAGMGFRIILKNAKIRAEKMIIKADKR